jgi:armadillo repeat-containing protein 6
MSINLRAVLFWWPKVQKVLIFIVAVMQLMSIIWVLCLRSPDNAARAIEAGAGDLAVQAMLRFPESDQLQRSACLMIRNLVVRNPENRQASLISCFSLPCDLEVNKFWDILDALPFYRTLLLGNGIEKLIRKAKGNHKSCKDAATDALRDLGVDNYNA